MFCAVLTLPSGVVFIIPLGKVLVQEFGAEGSLVRWKFPAPHFRAVGDPASGWVWLWNPSLLCLCLVSLLVFIWEELIVLLVAQAFDTVTRQCSCELWVQASWNMYRCISKTRELLNITWQMWRSCWNATRLQSIFFILCPYCLMNHMHLSFTVS